MRITYFEDTDTLHIELRDRAVDGQHFRLAPATESRSGVEPDEGLVLSCVVQLNAFHSGSAVWNNDDDVATLRDARGGAAARYVYE